MINRTVLVGRLVDKPELRRTGDGVAVVHFTLAVERPFKNQQGERETDFIDIVAWRNNAEFAAHYLDRGRWAGVDGRLQIRSYTTQEGQTRKVTEVVADSVQAVGPVLAVPAQAPVPAQDQDQATIFHPPVLANFLAQDQDQDLWKEEVRG